MGILERDENGKLHLTDMGVVVAACGGMLALGYVLGKSAGVKAGKEAATIGFKCAIADAVLGL